MVLRRFMEILGVQTATGLWRHAGDSPVASELSGWVAQGATDASAQSLAAREGVSRSSQGLAIVEGWWASPRIK